MIVISGSGAYPRLIVEGAHAAGVRQVDVLAVRGSTARATVKVADNVHVINIGGIAAGLRWVAAQGYDGACFAGQINPLSLFTARFDAETKGWLDSLSVKNAHTVYGKLAYEFEAAGVKVFPASSFMDGHLPGVGALTNRTLTDREASDVAHGAAVMRDMGRHDVGQTVLVKEGMVLAVEAFEGTNAAIKRGGKLGGKGAVIVKGAREGHDMRFDIPVVGLKTLKVMQSAGVTALAFQAGRLVLLDREAVVAYANKHNIALVGIATDLPPAPLRP
ncbi:MAG: UDP-2,3-diacylglucosamine diphosphatase LpxI [Kiritimatiellae bacterium]|nr:UDP-2,3-diacylglucosamine diphosphatase LpxI [Kiritimatiellia bacterium]